MTFTMPDSPATTEKRYSLSPMTIAVCSGSNPDASLVSPPSRAKLTATGRAGSYRTSCLPVPSIKAAPWAVTTIALVVIAIIARRLPPGRTWTLGGLALVFGGAVGNLIDRVRWGEVVDFLDVFWKTHHWPAFNVADSAITVGVTLLLVDEFIGKKVGDR